MEIAFVVERLANNLCNAFRLKVLQCCNSNSQRNLLNFAYVLSCTCSCCCAVCVSCVVCVCDWCLRRLFVVKVIKLCPSITRKMHKARSVCRRLIYRRAIFNSCDGTWHLPLATGVRRRDSGLGARNSELGTRVSGQLERYVFLWPWISLAMIHSSRSVGVLFESPVYFLSFFNFYDPLSACGKFVVCFSLDGKLVLITLF